MPSLENRPYSGNWKPNRTKVVKYTPDALVYINGDLSIPGCASCNGRIDIQKFITSISTDSSVDPTGHSASITLSLPKAQGEQVFVDGKHTLRPGLEVHIFMRGYFPISGQFQHLVDPQQSLGGEEQFDLSNYASYPYYPVFHGLVTQSSYEYSDGFYTGSLSCASLLHFWQFQNIVSNASFLGARPRNSPGKTSLYGHNFNNMHPYGIIHTLYRDTAGAAMAVEFALSEESNLDAVSRDGSQQIFDQVAMYWENRFKTRVFSLRMYGVNGQLFNAAQQAFLASASNRDIRKLLSNNTYADPETSRSESDPFSSRFSVAKALGLANGGLDLTYAPLVNQDGDAVNLSLLDMYAFNQDISGVGSVQIFETTYQTKMEVAQQVMEVTGFELYQDVDGDLVFKPPFYNLDTSTSRVYRLEDEDIISSSFSEKEPEATFISVRPSWFKGLTGVVPNTGATGKRALYVDYTLVAQFGWRPASMEISYTTDPRIAFYIGVARLDRLNIDVNSATITIPIRAELRPGYPVYIPYVDCFYYVNSFNHAYSFGGSCTTTLTLTCRRAKFDPPAEFGQPNANQSAVDLVKLDRPDLPRRKLWVYDKGGEPRHVGFPNVVLALDPEKGNPHFFPVGAGLDYINSDQKVDDLVQYIREDLAAQTPQIFGIEGQEVNEDGQIINTPPAETSVYTLRLDQDNVVRFTLDELRKDFSDLQDIRNRIQSAEAAVRSKTAEVQALTSRENIQDTAFGLAGGNGGGVASRPQAIKDLEALEGELQDARQSLLAETGDGGAGSQNRLVAVVTALQSFRGSPSRRKIDGLPGSDVKATYFDSLLNIKSQYALDDLPGRYRYYSCSHPDPAYQGQPIMIFDDGEAQNAEPTLPSQTDAFSSESADDAPPVEVPSDGLGDSPPERLQAKLDALGILWIGLKYLNPETLRNTIGWPLGTKSGSAGISRRAGKNGLNNLPEEISDNIVNILDVANDIRNNLSANPDFEGFTIGAISTYRVPGEAHDSEAMHKYGIAVDLGMRPKRQEYTGDLEVYWKAFYALKAECFKAFAEGRVNFMQVYENRGSREDFVHIDQRDDYYLNLEKKPKFDAYKQAGFPVNGMKSLKGNYCRRYQEALNEAYAKNSDLPKAQRGAVSAQEAAQVVPEAAPYVAAGLAPCPKFPGTGVFYDSRSRDFRTGEKYSVSDQFADMRTMAADAGIDFDAVFSGNGRDTRKNKVSYRKKPRGKRFPLSGEAQKVPPLPAPKQPQSRPSPQPKTAATITTRNVELDPPRQVVQFKKNPSTPPGLRQAEAELGLGPCVRGFNVAQGPGSSPAILTTDQIQTLSFVQFNSSKFADVVGVSQTTGSITLNTQTLQEGVMRSLMQAAEGANDPSQTPQDVFAEAYETIRTTVGLVEIPSFVNGVEEKPGAYIGIPAFGSAVSDIVVEEGSPLAAIAGAGSIPVATTSFQSLSALPGYSSPIPKTADAQTIGQTVEKVANAYAKAIVSTISQAFQTLVQAASNPKTEKGERLARLEGAFSAVASGATGDASSISTTILENIKQDLVGQSTKSARNKFVPVFPVSDEKGYEHFGAYRYGRGLTVDPGGTFEFVHSNGDPFENIDAKTAEEFLRALTQVKAQGNLGDSDEQKRYAYREAELNAAQKEDREESSSAESGQTPSGVPLGSAPSPDAIAELSQVFSDLNSTSQGQEALRALLEGNGDDPNLISQDSFDIGQTQFARNFSNFSANYAKSPVFKTTVTNAAYRLVDLTSHLSEGIGGSCRCRGYQSDLDIVAFGSKDFVTIEGVDAERDPATALLSQEILETEEEYSAYMKQVSGSIEDGSSGGGQ